MIEQLIAAGDEAGVERALREDPTLAAAKTADGTSLILVAVFSGKGAIAEKMAAVRDDLDLCEAAALGKLARVEELIARGAPVNAFGAFGFTALHYAAHLGHLECARALLDGGADPGLRATGRIDATPLHSAVAGQQLETTRLLIERGAPIDATYEGGYTALDVATKEGLTAIAELLKSSARRQP
jgi:ankyrin repeat protein